MKNYKPYPKYKNSGIPWLGDIPEHWEVKRIKNLGKIKSGESIINSELKDNGQYEVFGGNGLMGFSHKFNVENENIIIGRVGAYCGNVRFIKDKKFISDNALILNLFNNENYSYVTISLKCLDLNKLNTSSAQPLITGTKVSNVFVPYPTKSEQTAIAAFLDYKLAKINRFIQKKNQLIKLLNEQKAAIINQAVTKGLDENVKMKESGIEWLGDIPEHWEVTRAKYLGKAIIGLTYSPSEETDSENGILVLRSSNVQNEKITFDDCVYVTTEIPENKITRMGDILICSRNGSIKLIGKNALIDEKAEGLTFGAFMTIFRSPNYDFLHYFFNSASFKAQSGLFSTSTINQLTTGILNNIIVTIPKSLEEQLEIVEFIKTETATINTTISTIEKELALTEEYKTALIAEAVTGKIDVRGYELGIVSNDELISNDELGIMNDELEAVTELEEQEIEIEAENENS